MKTKLEPSYVDITDNSFDITFESDFALLNYEGTFETFIASRLSCQNGMDIETDVLRAEVFVDKVTNHEDKLVTTYPDLDSQIEELILEALNESA